MRHDYDPAFDAAEEPEITEIDFGDGDYQAKWGLSDFNEGDEAIIREAWDRPDFNFKADWGCKKEIQYAHVERVDGVTTIRATACVDELHDLIDTCIWKDYGGNDKCNSGWDAVCRIFNLNPNTDDEIGYEKFDEICEALAECYEEYHEAQVELPVGATWDDFINGIDEASTKAEAHAEECFKSLVESVKRYMENYWDVQLEEEAEA